MIAGILVTPETREVGYTWLKAHLDEMLNGAGGIFLAARLPSTLAGFCSVDQAKEFEALRPRFAGRSGALELERTIERVRDCGVLKDARGAELSAAVAKIK